MKISTKTGDRGETSLFGGKRLSKGDEYFDALGTLDELHSFLGFTKLALPAEKIADYAPVVERAQDDLYRMMSIIGFEMKVPKTIENFDEKDVEFLEREMEKHKEAMASLDKFIRTGTTEIAARFHVARSICRRAERILVRINCPEEILKYVNRLSDLLFVFGYSLEEKIAKM